MLLSARTESNQWPRPPSLAPSGQFTLRIAGGRVPVEFCRISGMQNLSDTLNSRRATGPWVCKNCIRCGPSSAPGFAEQVIVGLLSACRPVSGPYEKEGTASRFAVGAGPRPTCPRDSIPCRARPPGRAARACHVSAVGAAHWAARPQQAHSAPIPNICIQTSYKGINSSLFEWTHSLLPGEG